MRFLPFSSRLRTIRATALGGALALFASLGVGSALGQNVSPDSSSSCGSTATRSSVVIHTPVAQARALSLCEGRAMSLGAAKPAGGTPLTLTSADFDEDGVPDLVSGHAVGGAGTVVVYRGNIAALWPYGAAVQNGTPEPFLPNPHSFSLPETPDFLVAGDFDADGHQDILVAQRGSSAMYFLKGDGHGRFAAAKRFAVSGNITEMIAGEINQVDGLADLAVAVTGADGSAVLVYQSPMGALKAQPETYPVSQPATALALGKFSDIGLRDLAIGSGNLLTLVRGRDRQLSDASNVPAKPAVVTTQVLPFGIRSLAAGDFTGRAPGVAVLGDDGNLHVFEHAVTGTMLAAVSGTSTQPAMRAAGAGDDMPGTTSSGAASSAFEARAAALRQQATSGEDTQEWNERSSVAMPRGGSQVAPRLVAGRISGSLQDDLLVADSANSKVHVLSTVASQSQFSARATVQGGASSAELPQMAMLASMDSSSAPAAVLPMRLNQHGLSGLVVLPASDGTPIVMPRDTPPAAVFTVTNTLDITSPSQKNSPPAGSLRAAMNAAQDASSNNGGGSYSIVFNIPTSDPGYNAATGIYTIKPLSENVPGSQDNFALPPINATLTIDGYTQPGASPNTLANGENVKIAIQIDGSKATTSGGSGLAPYFDTGTVIRGLAFTGWTNASISSSGTASGAEGIEANGVGDFFEGNFFGTADGKTAGPNRIGIFADNGPLAGSAPGNTIGGTTPQARNILSGNTVYGIAFLSTAYEARLQGNFIGLDITGAKAMGNSFDGVGLNGSTITIGGTLPGARNYIAGNPTNVDINDLTNGNAATGSYVQGNYIGTDVTGTKGLSPTSTGVSILHNPSNYLIGGTTTSARNLISGNQIGVYIYDGSFHNIVQGNYIGTDATGTIAVPNLSQGFISGRTTSTSVPAGFTTIGGAVPGAGNVISGNASDGVQINGSAQSSGVYIGSTIQGNFIGTDATGTKPLPNGGNGVSIATGATNNQIGGSNFGLGNLIANNALNGVLIDPGTTGGPGLNNTTVANIIASNGGAGVRVVSGTGNRISANSIYSNTALGIDIDANGPSTNTHCNATNTGANLLQNYPVLTAGTGTSFITATATDPNGNTSEFSKSVASTGAAGLLSLLGSFDGTANTKFTIEFFSNPSADPSGYGQGKTYLGSTSITTAADCTSTISDPVDTGQADVSVTLSRPFATINLGPDFGLTVYSAVIANNGPATAHSVVFTDTLPAQLAVSSTYCSVGACQSPIATSQGTCTVSGKTITCNLGTMATGGTANISFPVQAVATGDFTDMASVTATEPDPNPLNNTSSVSATATNPFPFIDHLDPTTALAGSGPVALNVYGVGFTSATAVTFNGTSLPVTGVVDNQVCGGPFQPSFCTALQVSIPASLLTAGGTFPVGVANPGVSPSGANFTVIAGCTYSVFSSIGSNLDSSGTNLIATGASVTTNVASCSWTATSTVPWAVILDNASATGSGRVDIAIAPNTTTAARSGSVTVAGTLFNFTQAAGSATVCNVALDPTTASVGSAGGAGTINATLSSTSCAPFAEAYPSSGWITITNKSSLLLNSGPVTYTVAPNTGPTRTGGISVGGTATLITQSAPSCYFTLSASSVLASSAGTTGSITVTPTPSTCSWTAVSSNTAQVSVTSGASGTGNGTVNYTVAPNTGGPIQPTIAIGNAISTSIFTINQTSANTCTFTISPNPKSVTSNGTTDYFLVTASFNFCKWTAASNNPDSIAITGGASGTGNGAVYYNVAKNTGTDPRTLSITAGCQQFVVNQDGSAVSNPAPALTSIAPSSVVAGSGALTLTLTLTGTGFINGSTVNINGSPRVTTYVSDTQLTAAILAGDVATEGSAAITVTTGTPGGGTSNAVTLTITAASNPVPAITSLQPATAAAGSGAFTLTVNGTGFVSGSTVSFNGTVRVTTYVSATQLTAAILASDVASAGTAPVVVNSPTPGGGASNSVNFTITATNPVPTITTLSPSSVNAGSGAFTLTVNGTNFVSGSTVNFNGSARTTTFVSATQLTAAITASDVTTAGTTPVTVVNPTPGGGTSNAVSFTITATNPVPTVTTLSPVSVNAGSGAFTLTVNGTNFVSGSTVNFNGNARTTTFVSATQLTAAITANDVTTAGTAPVTVVNPTPGGGTSNAVSFTITATNPVPTVTSLSPASVTAGAAAFTLTVNGTNFVTGSTVNFNGGARTTTFVSATQLTAAITATDVASAGTAPVTVVNPTPGGGTSNAVSFTITAVVTNPVPTITTLSPASTNAGSGAFTLTVNGTNFISGSTVNFNGTARATTFVSATQLTAAILAADVATAGTAPVTVVNAAPGGGTSNAVTFTIGSATASYGLSSSTAAQTIAPGGSASYAITATAKNGAFGGTITLSASGLPAGAGASFSPATVSPGSGSASSTLTVTVPATHAKLKETRNATLALLLPLGGLLMMRRARRTRLGKLALLAFALTVSAVGMTGCGGGFSYYGSNPQTFNITVTGTSGSTQQSTTVQLTVNY